MHLLHRGVIYKVGRIKPRFLLFFALFLNPTVSIGWDIGLYSFVFVGIVFMRRLGVFGRDKHENSISSRKCVNRKSD